MQKNKQNPSKENGKVEIKSLEDLICLNLNTLEDVVGGGIDNRKAAMIFTGSRTVTTALKLGIEAMKLGMAQIAGMPVGDEGAKLLTSLRK